MNTRAPRHFYYPHFIKGTLQEVFAACGVGTHHAGIGMTTETHLVECKACMRTNEFKRRKAIRGGKCLASKT